MKMPGKLLVVAFCLLSIQGFAKTILISNNKEIYNALPKLLPGDTLLFKNGVYKDLQLVLTKSGTKKKPIVILSETPGSGVISGDAKVELRGEHLIFSGFSFKDGSRNPAQWKSHGPGLVAIYGSYNRVTNCAFDAFDEANSAWITTSLTADGKVPQHCRIDHCSFTNKITFDQVINLNNAFAPQKDSAAGGGPPMYHRVDHNFFSNPPKPGNAGGGIRVGYYRYDTGRCLIDSNLFMRQDSEGEIITSKSRENVYYANTFINCRGTMNFRHGDAQVAINNFFIGTDTLFGYGGMFVWGSQHVIGANYFELPRTINSRGNAALYLNPGAQGTEHALAFNITIVNNAFINTGGYAVHFNPLDKQRKKQCEENGWTFQTPHDIRFYNNFFYSGSCASPFFRNDYNNQQRHVWKNNIATGCTLGISKTNGIDESICRIEKKDIYLPPYCKAFDYTEVENVPPVKGIALDISKLISRGIIGKPLSFGDAGSSWHRELPDYTKKGKLPTELKAAQQRVIAQRD